MESVCLCLGPAKGGRAQAGAGGGQGNRSGCRAGANAITHTHKKLGGCQMCRWDMPYGLLFVLERKKGVIRLFANKQKTK